MEVECDCGLVFTDKQLVIIDDGAVNWMCPNCGDCKEWFNMKKKGYFIIVPEEIDIDLIKLYNLIQDEFKISNDEINIKEIDI